MKIRIVIPMPDDCELSAGTNKSIENLIKARPDIIFKKVRACGSQVFENRNYGVSHNPDYDYCLQVDNRKTFTIDDFNALYAMNCDVAAGWYTLRREEGFATSYLTYDDNENGINCFDLVKKDEIIKCTHFGTGFHLVKRIVYDKMDKNGILDYYCPAKRKGRYTSEDIGFCDNLKLIGVVPKINKNVFIEREQLTYLKECRSMKSAESKVVKEGNSRRKIVEIGNVISGMKKWKKIHWKMSPWLNAFWVLVRGVYEDTVVWEQDMAERKREAMLKHCTKDPKDNTPIMEDIINNKGVVVGKRYAGLIPGQCPEYDKKIKEMDTETEKYFDEIVDVDLSGMKKIKWDGEFPRSHDEFNTEMFETLLPWIDGVEEVK